MGSRPFVLLTARHAILVLFFLFLFLFVLPFWSPPLLPLITRCLFYFLSATVCAFVLCPLPLHTLSFIFTNTSIRSIHSLIHSITPTTYLRTFARFSFFIIFFSYLLFASSVSFLVYTLFLSFPFLPPLHPSFSNLLLSQDRFQGHVQILPASIATDSLANSSSSSPTLIFLPLSQSLSLSYSNLSSSSLSFPSAAITTNSPPLLSNTSFSKVGQRSLRLSTTPPRLCRGTHHTTHILSLHTHTFVAPPIQTGLFSVMIFFLKKQPRYYRTGLYPIKAGHRLFKLCFYLSMVVNAIWTHSHSESRILFPDTRHWNRFTTVILALSVAKQFLQQRFTFPHFLLYQLFFPACLSDQMIVLF